MKVALGKFACSGSKPISGDDIAAGVRDGAVPLRPQAEGRAAGRRAPALPRPTRRRRSRRSTFDLTVDAETEAVLEQEARRQGTTMSQLAAHSVLVYLAELEFLGVAPQPARLHGAA